MNRLLLVGLIVAGLVIVTVVWLIRGRRLQERHALLWIVGALVIVVLGVSESALASIARVLGIAYPPAALLLMVVGFLGLALLDTVIATSKQSDRVRELAQEIALLSEQVRSRECDSDPDYASTVYQSFDDTAVSTEPGEGGFEDKRPN